MRISTPALRVLVAASLALAVVGLLSPTVPPPSPAAPAVAAPTAVCLYRVGCEALGPYQGITFPNSHFIVFDGRVPMERTLARTTAAHEIGHALGCGHFLAPGTVMFPAHDYGEPAVDRLTADEIDGARRGWSGLQIVLDAGPSVSQDMRDALAWGAALWNRALGVEAVRLLP